MEKRRIGWLDLGWERVKHILRPTRISSATGRISLTTMCVVQSVMGTQSIGACKGVHLEDNDR